MQWDSTPTQIPAVLSKIKNVGQAWISHGDNVITLANVMVSANFNALATIHIKDTGTAIETNRNTWHGSGGGTTVQVRNASGTSTPAFTRVNAITLNAGENGLINASAIDITGGFAYFGTQTSPAKIAKINLTTFTEVATLTLNVGENVAMGAVIAGGFLYVGTMTSPAKIVKINLTTFTEVATLTLNVGENNAMSIVVDGLNNFLYVGCGVDPMLIVKINLTTFTEVATLNQGGDVTGKTGASIDSFNGFAYFNGIGTFFGKVLKVRLSDFTIVSIISLNTNAAISSIIDTTNQFLYVGDSGGPGTVFKINLATFTTVNTLVVTPNVLNSASIDITNGFGYFCGNNLPAIISKVNLSTLTETAALTLNAGENDAESSVIDLINGFLYVGTNTSPGKVVKITTSANVAQGAMGRLLVRLTGGYSYSYDGDSNNSLERYDDFGNSNSTFTASTLNGFAATGWGINGYIYSVDGFTGATSSSVFRFGQSENAWIVITSTNAASSDLTGFTLNGLGYKTCGFGAGHVIVVAFTEQYNPSTNAAWTQMTAAITARRDLAGFALANLGFAVGGSTDGATAINPSPNERFDPIANNWTSRTAMTTPLFFISGTSLDGFGLVFDGTNDGDASSQNIIQQFDDVANSWSSLGNSGGVASSKVSAVSLNGYAIINGGHNTAGTALSTRYRYDRIAGTFTSKVAMSQLNGFQTSANWVETWVDYQTMEP